MSRLSGAIAARALRLWNDLLVEIRAATVSSFESLKKAFYISILSDCFIVFQIQLILLFMAVTI